MSKKADEIIEPGLEWQLNKIADDERATGSRVYLSKEIDAEEIKYCLMIRVKR